MQDPEDVYRLIRNSWIEEPVGASSRVVFGKTARAAAPSVDDRTPPEVNPRFPVVSAPDTTGQLVRNLVEIGSPGACGVATLRHDDGGTDQSPPELERRDCGDMRGSFRWRGAENPRFDASVIDARVKRPMLSVSEPVAAAL